MQQNQQANAKTRDASAASVPTGQALLREPFDQQQGKIILKHRERVGWYLLWPNGFVSAMPNEAAAKICQAALDGPQECLDEESSQSDLNRSQTDGD